MLPVEHSEALSRHRESEMTARHGEGELLLPRVSGRARSERAPDFLFVLPEVSFFGIKRPRQADGRRHLNKQTNKQTQKKKRALKGAKIGFTTPPPPPPPHSRLNEGRRHKLDCAETFGGMGVDGSRRGSEIFINPSDRGVKRRKRSDATRPGTALESPARDLG